MSKTLNRREFFKKSLVSSAAGALVAASRSIAGASDPGEAADRLRDSLWQVSG